MGNKATRKEKTTNGGTKILEYQLKNSLIEKMNNLR
jgi:hypothetical protein